MFEAARSKLRSRPVAISTRCAVRFRRTIQFRLHVATRIFGRLIREPISGALKSSPGTPFQVPDGMKRLLRMLRLGLYGLGVFVALAGALFAYFVYTPGIEMPSLSGTLDR